ncbi:hypothetical protein VPHK449_0031 [Vibrio phage K449]
MKFGRDTNGNRTLKIETTELGGRRGFSIQTLGNLPTAHRATDEELKKSKALRHKVALEVEHWVKRWGSPKQKLGMYTFLAIHPKPVCDK